MCRKFDFFSSVTAQLKTNARKKETRNEHAAEQLDHFHQRYFYHYHVVVVVVVETSATTATSSSS
jgi:hypothetical protein